MIEVFITSETEKLPRIPLVFTLGKRCLEIYRKSICFSIDMLKGIFKNKPLFFRIKSLNTSCFSPGISGVRYF